MTKARGLRTQNYLKQIKGSTLFKLGTIVATFVAMPFMIKYLGIELFGVWVTMLTLISWVMLCDLGIGNGLKNKVSESLAVGNSALANVYISTAYMVVGGISVFLFFLFLIASFFLPWQSIFNTELVEEGALRNVVISLSFFVFFNFWISLVNQIYHGLQESSKVVFGQFISHLLSLLFVYLLYTFTQSSIIYMVWAYGISLVLANLYLSIKLFRQRVEFIPSVTLYDRKKVKSLLSLGIKFFVIQVAAIVIFLTDKIVITQLLGPAEVTPYEVLFKLFGLISVLHSLVLIPLWPAYSEAYVRKDFEWIHSQLKKQIIIACFLFVLAFLIAFLGPLIVKIWIGDDVIVDSYLYYWFAFFIVFSVWSNVFAYFVNAIGMLNIQVTTAILAALINIPLSIVFVKVYGLGLEGIILATIISLSLYSIAGPIQVMRILRKG